MIASRSPAALLETIAYWHGQDTILSFRGTRVSFLRAKMALALECYDCSGVDDGVDRRAFFRLWARWFNDGAPSNAVMTLDGASAAADHVFDVAASWLRRHG